jgi:hypothetical protein
MSRTLSLKRLTKASTPARSNNSRLEMSLKRRRTKLLNYRAEWVGDKANELKHRVEEDGYEAKHSMKETAQRQTTLLKKFNNKLKAESK